MERKYPGFRLETRLEGDNSYLCVPCFQRLEGVMRLRRQLVDEEMKVEEHLDNSIGVGALPLVEVQVPGPSMPPQTSQGDTASFTPRGEKRCVLSRRTTERQRRTLV